MAHSVNARDDNLAPKNPAVGGPGPSRDDVGEGTNTDMEIVEEGEEGEIARPVPAVIRGKPDLTPVTYRIGRSLVKEADLE